MKFRLTLLLFFCYCLSLSAQSVLFVDDNGLNSANSDTMINALNGVLKKTTSMTKYTHWNIKDSAGICPSSAQLSKYDLVFWYCSTDGVGLRFWNESTAGNAALASYIQSGNPVWIVGQDILYDQYVAPSTFKSGEFAYEYMGLTSYNVQSYVNDDSKGVPQLDKLNWSSASVNFPSTIKWTFRELWYVDGCTPRAGTFEMYKMGPEGYALDGAVSMFHHLSPTAKISVMSSFFDLALMDTYKNRVDFMASGIHYLLNKTAHIKNQEPKVTWSIYPNPTADGSITIAGSEEITHVLLRDMTNKKIVEYTIKRCSNASIAFKGLAMGVYQLSITGKNGVINTQTLVVNHQQ